MKIYLDRLASSGVSERAQRLLIDALTRRYDGPLRPGYPRGEIIYLTADDLPLAAELAAAGLVKWGGGDDPMCQVT